MHEEVIVVAVLETDKLAVSSGDVDMIFLSSVCVTVRKIVSVTTGETEEDSSCGRA